MLRACNRRFFFRSSAVCRKKVRTVGGIYAEDAMLPKRSGMREVHWSKCEHVGVEKAGA